METIKGLVSAFICQKASNNQLCNQVSMLPNVVVYNSVSVDGAIKDFDVNIALHYEVLGGMGTYALLAGSNTAKTGIELFMKRCRLKNRATSLSLP